MSITDFFRRFMVHATLAFSVWYVAALSLERLIPGFVSPFVNLPGVGLFLIVLACVALAVSSPDVSRAGRIVSLIMLVILLIGSCLFLWTRVNDLGGLGLMVMCATLGSIVLLCVVFWRSDEEM